MTKMRGGGGQDVDIEDQIRNAQFMYPSKPWSNISKAAVACIQQFLVVQHEARYTVGQALADQWISDKQCMADLARLEEEASSRFEFSDGAAGGKKIWFSLWFKH